MDRLVTYLLLILLVIAAWNESLRSRVQRLMGAETPNGAQVAKPTPFWQHPDYKSALERGQDKLDARQSTHTQMQRLQNAGQ